MRWRRKQPEPERPGPPGLWHEGETVEFIRSAGGCVASKRILEGVGRLRFMVRDESVDPVDNGWRFFSEFDDDEYVDDASNLEVVDFNRMCTIEPAVIGIWDLPVGSDLELVIEDRRRYFVDVTTGREIPSEELWPPRPPGV